MRKVILLFSIIIFTSNTYGQKMTLNDLIKIVSMSWDDFDTYSLSKGYHYDENDSKVDVGKKTVAYEKDNGKYYVHRMVLWGINGDYENNPDYVHIGYNTINTTEYLSIKNQAKSSGYKLTSTEIIDGKNWLTYRKEDFKVTLISGYGTYIGGGQTTYVSYEISVGKYYGRYKQIVN